MVCTRGSDAEPTMGKGESYQWLGVAMAFVSKAGFGALLRRYQDGERWIAFRAAVAVFAAKMHSSSATGAVTFNRRILATVVDAAAFKEADLRLLSACAPAGPYMDQMLGATP